MTTTSVKVWNSTQEACAERDGDAVIVRVYDPVAGHYTTCHSLTPGQIRRVISTALAK